MYPSKVKVYARKRPTMSISLASDLTTLIDSLSITMNITKSSLLERLLRLVLDKFTLEEILEFLSSPPQINPSE